MAHIVSVEWNVEDFRRLIGEQSQLSEAKPLTAKTIDVVGLEIVDGGKPGHKTSDEIADSCGAAVAVPPAFTDPAVPPAFAAKREVTPKSSLLQNAIEEPDIRAGKATHGENNVLYRGVAFSKVKSARGELWRWSVLVGEPAMLRMGEADSEQQAELNARSVIDRMIAVEETLRRLKRSDRSD
jgi:hypothetical protein